MNRNYTKYLGIPFKHRGRGFDGVDCYGLLVLYYKTEFNIDLPDFWYEFNWSKTGKDIISDNYPSIAKPVLTPEKNDIALFRVSFGCPVVNHAGIVVEPPNKILQAMKVKVILNDLSSPILRKHFDGYYRLCLD